MARNQSTDEIYQRPLRRLVLVILCVFLIGLALLWRIDNPRAERIRAALVDRVVPSFEWALAPVTWAGRLIEDFEGYARVYEQNQDLRRELQQMTAWREAAIQLEQENARLRDLNKVRLSPDLTYISGVVLTDSGSPFRRSVLLNIGSDDGIQDGWAAMDGLGLVGRIAGVGARTSRVILLTDGNSRIPVTIQPSGKRAILAGDTTATPALEFVENPEDVRAGDRIVTSGDGGVFPADLLVGQVVRSVNGQLRVRLAAETGRLEYLRVLRTREAARIDDTGALIAPPAGPVQGPPAPGDLAQDG
ncbi:cell shape-determining protein MreC [Jannaschia pagri]|uniref:Cell shape-determining protein MreC n=1 Tax=Jannaschia pagri TaxID=2829797 RepID=A0ABQ4NJL3_9RHOB|nr:MULTISPECIES: rod shape-determining protein MreC [unclassified Jannaschia]GIT90780.1 cell shape-determining protein MreC [Jannaschia sp. AI_61]GIT94612.1 cell shape-determining protein MreC [Jannaschia sp. AI_62]